MYGRCTRRLPIFIDVNYREVEEDNWWCKLFLVQNIHITDFVIIGGDLLTIDIGAGSVSTCQRVVL